jgi:hypothetical protein
MNSLFARVLGSGFATSEFAVSLLTMFSVTIMPKIDAMVNGATTSLDHHGVAGQIAAAAVGAAYVAGRSTIKAIAAKGLQADPNVAK